MEQGSSFQVLNVSTGPIDLSSGDYFELMAQTESDTSITIEGNESNETYLAIAIHPAATQAFSGCRLVVQTDLTTINASNGIGGYFVPFGVNDEIFDTNGYHDTGSNTERITIPAGVNYARLEAGAWLQSGTADDYVNIRIQHRNSGGTFIRNYGAAGLENDDGFLSGTVSTGVISVSEGDYFRLLVTTETDTSVTIGGESGSSTPTFFCIEALDGPVQVAVDSDDVSNVSTVTGTTVSDALETLATVRGCKALMTTDDTTQDYTSGGGGPKAISFDSAEFDTDSMFSGASPTKITIPSGVSYVDVSGQVYFSSDTADTWKSFTIRQFNSSNTLLRIWGPVTLEYGATLATSTIAAVMVPVSSGDYFALYGHTESDTSITVVGTSTQQTYLTVKILG